MIPTEDPVDHRVRVNEPDMEDNELGGKRTPVGRHAFEMQDKSGYQGNSKLSKKQR